MLRAQRIEKVYHKGAQALSVLNGLDFEMLEGEAVAIVGSSGAGKSTFLHILGALDTPSAGHVYFDGHDIFKWKDQALARFRNEKLGFVFQFHHLFAEFSALENIAVPGRIAGQSFRESEKRAEELLEKMGLKARGRHYPSELSGGEQQRVAIARALFMNPKLILADEPTGNLDSENSRRIQDVLFDLHKQGLSMVVVTHDLQFASRFPRTLRLSDGHWIF